LSSETKSFVVLEQGVYLLQNLTIIDGTGAPAIINQDILIEGDVIKDIGAIRSLEIVFKNGIGYDSKKLFKSAEGFVGIR
jgi:hypothetical protein